MEVGRTKRATSVPLIIADGTACLLPLRQPERETVPLRTSRCRRSSRGAEIVPEGQAMSEESMAQRIEHLIAVRGADIESDPEVCGGESRGAGSLVRTLEQAQTAWGHRDGKPPWAARTRPDDNPVKCPDRPSGAGDPGLDSGLTITCGVGGRQPPVTGAIGARKTVTNERGAGKGCWVGREHSGVILGTTGPSSLLCKDSAEHLRIRSILVRSSSRRPRRPSRGWSPFLGGNPRRANRMTEQSTRWEQRTRDGARNRGTASNRRIGWATRQSTDRQPRERRGMALP